MGGGTNLLWHPLARIKRLLVLDVKKDLFWPMNFQNQNEFEAWNQQFKEMFITKARLAGYDPEDFSVFWWGGL